MPKMAKWLQIQSQKYYWMVNINLRNLKLGKTN